MSLPFSYRLLSERLLLDRINGRDIQAENFVSVKYYPAVKRQLKKYLGDRQYQGRELGDFCQDVMLFFLANARHRGVELLKEGGTIERWLNATIRYKMLEIWNNQERVRELTADLTDERFNNHPEETTYHKTEQRAEVEQAIAQLDEEESSKFGKGFVKQLCAYRFAHLMTWEEVTEALNEDFPNYETFPMKKPLTWTYVSRGLWNGNYDKRLRDRLKSTRG